MLETRFFWSLGERNGHNGTYLRRKGVYQSAYPEWHSVKGVFRGIFTPTKRSAVPRSLEKAP